MKVYAFPADDKGCGHYRIIWPAEQLKREGVDITVIDASSGNTGLQAVVDGDRLVSVSVPADADVVLFQRVSHKLIADAIPMLRAQGVAVVVEIDDDLTRIDPRNPAFDFLHPKGKFPEHSWHNTTRACRDATMVVTSTPALLDVFARHGRGRVFYNYVQERWLDVPRLDSSAIGWPGSVHSHPGDLQVMGASVSQLSQRGYDLCIIGNGEGVHQAWGLDAHTPIRTTGVTEIHHWPFYVAQLGVGVAPLSDTKFNAAKSWLKMAEMAAVGVPCVGSPRAEYSRLHREHGIGLLAETPKDWFRTLKALADDDRMREELSLRGREAMRGLTMEGNAWRLAEILEEAVKLQRS